MCKTEDLTEKSCSLFLALIDASIFDFQHRALSDGMRIEPDFASNDSQVKASDEGVVHNTNRL
jgi:hypothetical protein